LLGGTDGEPVPADDPLEDLTCRQGLAARKVEEDVARALGVRGGLVAAE
jgi:hypothetical protein